MPQLSLGELKRLLHNSTYPQLPLEEYKQLLHVPNCSWNKKKLPQASTAFGRIKALLLFPNCSRKKTAATSPNCLWNNKYGCYMSPQNSVHVPSCSWKNKTAATSPNCLWENKGGCYMSPTAIGKIKHLPQAPTASGKIKNERYRSLTAPRKINSCHNPQLPQGV